jgi:hypothetical protein
MPMWTSLGNPHPLTTPSPYEAFRWPVGAGIPMPRFEVELLGNMGTFDGRRSRRKFAPLSETALGALLWHTSRTQNSKRSPLGFDIEQRPAPSAGAIHPIHVLIFREQTKTWARYNPVLHSLEPLGAAGERLEPFVQECNSIVPIESGDLLLYVAEPGKTSAKYAHSESLVWRDAGTLQGVMSVASEVLGLNFCLLGVTGEPWASSLDQKGKLRGVGAAILGARS